eukprot:Rhum_TRINITY_DN8843_c1_g1::Rhum_TRINITY_DN8843_c1_g1_i1::g.30008::m.30008
MDTSVRQAAPAPAPVPQACAAPHPVQHLLARIADLTRDKASLLRCIEEEGEAHRSLVARLRERAAKLRGDEAALLAQHASGVAQRREAEGLSAATLEQLLSNSPLRSSRAPAAAAAAAQQQLQPPSPLPLPLAVGREVRVRDGGDEEWKYGTVTGHVGQTPLVTLHGWRKALEWRHVEAKP